MQGTRLHVAEDRARMQAAPRRRLHSTSIALYCFKLILNISAMPINRYTSG